MSIFRDKKKEYQYLKGQIDGQTKMLKHLIKLKEENRYYSLERYRNQLMNIRDQLEVIEKEQGPEKALEWFEQREEQTWKQRV